jgi:hypothetical protein
MHCGHKHNLANKIGGGGGGPNLPWVLGTLFYKGVKFERGENLSHKTQAFYFLFSIFYLLLLNSVTK